MPRTAHRALARALIATITLAAAMVATVPVATAGRPVTQTLNPVPPPIYTCKAVGGGTICDESQIIEHPAAPTDVFCGSGATGFQIHDQGIEHQHATRWYDTDGNLTRRIVYGRWTDAQWTNPLTGHAVPYTQNTTAVDVLATPGDFDSSTRTERGENVYHSPDGRVVMRSVGRTVIGPGDELLEYSGKQWAIELFFFGDESVLDGVCAVLG